ncbi:MAG: ABC transporter permease [Clostridiaceae bacterium]|nr:ABC transporter permease [Clostridiaceae bacterium]
MRMTTIGNSIKESIFSIIRHPMVTIASITTISLMLVLIGSFMAFSINAQQILERAGQQPPIEITMEIGVDEEQLDSVEEMLKQHEDVLESIRYTPQQNFEHFKENMDAKDLFEDFPVENIPYTFMVRLSDPDKGESFSAQIRGLPGVRKVTLEQSVMRFLSQAIVWVQYASLIAFIVLSIISFFIISNMVRVAVFSRGEEINIMKYVGATNWYIRVPYILEGALVGLAGALLAWGVTLFAYERLYATLMSGVKPTDILAMVEPGAVSGQLLWIYLLIGIGIGSLGSAVSVRRHIFV